jgi:citronellol/citronellal dehydrogenase
MADAAYEILIRDSKEVTGQFFIDDEVLEDSGVSDFSQYSVEPGADLVPDFFLD